MNETTMELSSPHIAKLHRLALVIGILLTAEMRSHAAAAETVPPATVQLVSQNLLDALKSLKTSDATRRQAVYDLILKQGDARLVPAIRAYKDGQLQLRDDRLTIYGPRAEVPGRGSVLPLIDAITADQVNGPDGQPIYVPKPDLSQAMKAPPPAEKRFLNDVIAALSLNDPDPNKRKDAIISAGDRADEALLPALKTQLANTPSGPYA